MGGVDKRFAGYFERSTDACSLGRVMDDPDPSMSRARSRELRACPIMPSRWTPRGITPALTERRERFEFVSGVDGKIGEANHPRDEPTLTRDVASVQRIVIPRSLPTVLTCHFQPTRQLARSECGSRASGQRQHYCIRTDDRL